MRLDERIDAASLKDLGRFEPEDMVADLDEITVKGASLRDLYVRWEKQNWSAHSLDFTQDAADWAALDPAMQERLLWVTSLFFIGEEAVTGSLAAWVLAAPTHDMEMFLSTQVADEARHTVFFDRFFSEAVGAGGSFSSRLQEARAYMNPSYGYFFYDMLPRVAAELVAKPKDPVTFARGVAMYHLVIEGALAVPAQKYLLALCRDRDMLPAFRSGFTAVARDESRHVGAGVRILRELQAMDPDCAPAVQDLVAEALPQAAGVFQPPHGDFTYMTMLGYDVAEMMRFGLFSLDKRLRGAGIDFPRSKPSRLPELKEVTLAERELTPVQEVLRPIRDQLTPELIFMGLPSAFNPEAAGDLKATFEFVIPDAGTWHVAVADGACTTEASPSASEPDWRMTVDAKTWIEISTGQMSGQEAYLMGRVTTEGDPLVGTRFDMLFRPAA